MISDAGSAEGKTLEAALTALLQVGCNGSKQCLGSPVLRLDSLIVNKMICKLTIACRPIRCLQGLAKSIAWDGEGATCLMEIECVGARSDAEARQVRKQSRNASLTGHMCAM